MILVNHSDCSQFSEVVTVTGTPQITLETGTADAVVNYTGTGTNALTFNYTVVEGHLSSDLDYISTNALALNGGTINDGAGNASTLTLAAPGAASSLAMQKRLLSMVCFQRLPLLAQVPMMVRISLMIRFQLRLPLVKQ